MKRREFLRMAATAPFAAMAFGGSSDRLRLEGEYEIGCKGMEPLVVSVFSDGEMGVIRGKETLLPARIQSRNGWKAFRGKFGTCFRGRRTKHGDLEIDYFRLVEPRLA